MNDIRRVEPILTQFQKEFGGFIEHTGSLSPDIIPHPHVRVFSFSFNEADTEIVRQEFRARLEAINWHYSEYERRPNLMFIAPMLFVLDCEIAYHATRTVSLEAIMREGLIPSNSTISVTGRADCVGNIYACEELGEEGSCGLEPKRETAFWWRWYFRQTNRCNDPDWSVLMLRLHGLSPRIYRDVWSTSGLIINGIERIPTDRIAVVPAV